MVINQDFDVSCIINLSSHVQGTLILNIKEELHLFIHQMFWVTALFWVLDSNINKRMSQFSKNS